MILNGSKCGITLKLNHDNLEIVDRYKYLGVTFAAKRITNLFKEHFSLMLEKAKMRVAVIRRFGFREDGLGLASSIRLYKLLVRPILEYCAQSLTYTRYSDRLHPETIPSFSKELEHFQTQTLKKLLSCLRNTSPAIVRLFCGVEPIASRLEILKLRYFLENLTWFIR